MSRADYIAGNDDRNCFLFTLTGGTECENYLNFSPEIFSWIYRVTEDIGAVIEIVNAYRVCLKSDFAEEIRSMRRSDNRDMICSRSIALSVMVAWFIENIADERPSCIAFRSLGVQAAYLFAGCLTMQQYIQHMLPIYTATLCSSGQCEQHEPRVEALVSSRKGGALDSMYGASGSGTIVDGLGSSACVLRDPMERVSDLMLSEDAVRAAADAIVFHPPRCTIVGVAGEVVPKDCQNQDLLRSTFVEGIIDHRNTGKIMQAVHTLANKTIIVGMPSDARAFSDDVKPGLACPIYPSEIIIPLATLV